MWIVSVLDDDYVTGRELAEEIASSRIGYRFVDAETLVERAAAWGSDREKLHRACAHAPRCFHDRLVRSKDVQVLQLRAAIAQAIQEGNAVCYGIAADLLNVVAAHIVRVRVKASYTSRLLLVQQRKGCDAAEGKRYLDTCERSRSRWRKYLLGSRPPGPGLLINLDETTVHEGCESVHDTIESLDRSEPAEADLGAIQKWALCAAVRAAVAQHRETRHLEIDVKAEGDAIVLSAIPPAGDGGAFPPRFPASVSRAVQDALAQHPATRHIHREIEVQGDRVVLRGILQRIRVPAEPEPLHARVEAKASRSQVDRAADEARSLHDRGPLELPRSRPLLARARILLRPAVWAPAGAAAVAFALILVAFSGRKRIGQPSRAPLEGFSGVITDTHCGVAPAGEPHSARCVWSCVRSGGAKYALSDGRHLILISNQQAAEAFAARKVTVMGELNPKSGELQIASVKTFGP